MKPDHAVIPKHYGEVVGYAAATLENSGDPIDKLNAPPLRTLQRLLETPSPAQSNDDARLGAWVRAQLEKAGPIKTVSGRDLYSFVLPDVARDEGLDAAITLALKDSE